MKYLTPQQIFTHAATHLVKQKKRCADASGLCLLFGPRGARCAIGCFLKPADKAVLRKTDDIDRGLDALRDFHADMLLRRGLDIHEAETRRLLEILQSIHDNDDYDDRFAKLVTFGRSRGFVIPRVLLRAYTGATH